MTPVEHNYCSNNRELLGLINGLLRFRCYLEGTTFKVFTETKFSVIFSKNNKSAEARPAGWMYLLEGEWPEEPKEKKIMELLVPKLKINCGSLEYNGKHFVPRKSVTKMLEIAHDSGLAGHHAFAKTLSRLNRFHWKHKTRDIREYCEGSLTCQHQNDYSGQTLHDPTQLDILDRRWSLVATALITELPEKRFYLTHLP